jgi:hypothetical protein
MWVAAWRLCRKNLLASSFRLMADPIHCWLGTEAHSCTVETAHISHHGGSPILKPTMESMSFSCLESLWLPFLPSVRMGHAIRLTHPVDPFESKVISNLNYICKNPIHHVLLNSVYVSSSKLMCWNSNPQYYGISRSDLREVMRSWG